MNRGSLALAALAGLGLMQLGLFAQPPSPPDPPRPAAPADTEKDPAKALQVKVFRLKHVGPDVAQNAFQQLLEEPDAIPPVEIPGGLNPVGPMPPGGVPVPGGALGVGGGALGVVGNLGIGGGMIGFGGHPPQQL